MLRWRLLIVAVALLAYAPALDNGFIADDFVILHRLDLLKANPHALEEAAPENFRLTSYAVFGAMRALFGYDYLPFYFFNIWVHAANCLLLSRLVSELGGKQELSVLSGVFFAVFQAPQEAVMWLAAMNETLQGLFIFLTLLLWFRVRYVLAAFTFLLALFSKESAVVVLPLLVLMEWIRGKHSPRRAWLSFVVPLAVFVIAFLGTLSHNAQVATESHVFGPHAVLVLVKSLHRLFWPWGYVVAALFFLLREKRPDWRHAAWTILIPTAMLPYVFVTYTRNIPSRQTYLASAVFLTLLAALILRFRARTLRVGLVAVFVAFNIVYMWTVKDSQMEKRAAPTSTLIAELSKHPPCPVRIRGFVYPYVDVAKAAAVTLPGWTWEDIDFDVPCLDCLILDWDAGLQAYQTQHVERHDVPR